VKTYRTVSIKANQQLTLEAQSQVKVVKNFKQIGSQTIESEFLFTLLFHCFKGLTGRDDSGVMK
jgi:hypothetical protein